MASTIIEPVADRIKVLIEAVSVDGVTLKTYRWAPPMGFDRLPAAVIDLPTIRRIDPDTSESQLGSEDWNLSFPLTLYIAVDKPQESQQFAAELIEEVIGAIDDDPGLSGVAGVIEARVVTADPSLDESDRARPVLVYTTRVDVIRLVAS